jgi:hypothetical protein
MRNSRTWNRVRDWVRLGAKVSLLCTDAKVRSRIGDELKDRMDDLGDNLSSKYEDAVDRVEAAAAALQGKSFWPSRAGSFVLGIGLGAGLGILLAPAAGAETREAVRDKAVDVKNRVIKSAASVKEKMRKSPGGITYTGTEG